ncbi:hypothetical protein BDF20DRAFT_982884 [Mycotypha africana]|uniref:uncharacterized protein n=1 Tax=Mycotypha africana TaxID=64632 RepID=UPI0023004FE7|nr:uncharacterized protein BDF20DRAFT_982884 [Mycotypha africana]KAI8967432.1 hypothetical protein BDF20DRAFT_982884 [Mycotypha africana]
MIRLQRLVYYTLSIAFFMFISLSLLPYLKTSQTTTSTTVASSSSAAADNLSAQDAKSTLNNPKLMSNEERYLSWFPHSDFPEQQESFRNALRLALETKRTIIAPMLRINKIYTWLPFEALAKRYEAMDAKELCQRGEKDSVFWQTELEPCDTINDWIEVPWSTIMDLETIKREYGIKIIERTQGHGWGIHETAPIKEKILPEDVVVVDVMSFKENGSDWEHVDLAQEALKAARQGSLNRFTNWIQSYFATKNSKDAPLTQPLKNVFYADQLNAIDAKIIQFGALNSAARYETTTSDIQKQLRKAMMKNRFLVPDQTKQLTQQADKIVNVLGGKSHFSTLILNMTKIVAMDAKAGVLKNIDPNQELPTTVDELSDESKTELMEAIVLELFGDIPINQAVSAAMPIKSSRLSNILNSRGKIVTDPVDRLELLEACVEYHKNIEKRYPVYYFINDKKIAVESRPDIFGPLLKMFPCTFTQNDMINWGYQSDSYLNGVPHLNDPNVDYEKLFQPLLNILIAQKGYSFFELPTTPLTRFLNWTPKNK